MMQEDWIGPSPSVTQLLQKWSDGDREAAIAVLPLVYDELRRIAARQLRGERAATLSRRPRSSTRPICGSRGRRLRLTEP